jgi:phage terminase large subunit
LIATVDHPKIAYELLPGQSEIFELERKHKAFIGGIGSGKTWFGGMWACMQAQTEGHGMVLAPTYRMLEDVTEPQLLQFLEAHQINFTHERGRGKINTASGTIFLRSAEKPDRLRGPNLAWAWGDEAAMWKESAWKVLIGRLRTHNARSLITTTPAGFNWVHTYFVEKESPQYGYVHGSSRENQHLDPDFVADLILDYTSEFAAQEIDGQFVAFEGIIYPEFRRDVNVEDFEIQEDWTLARSIDFGYTNPFVCLFAAIDHDGRIHVYNEWYQRRQLIPAHASGIQGIEERPISWTVSDWDAQESAELHAAGIPSINAKKEVKIGIAATKARWKRQPDGLPRLLIHPRCVNLIKELGMYRWKPAPDGAVANAHEEPLKVADHACDALRYLVMQVDHAGFVIV